MSHELVTGSERAIALQATIQQELAVKGYSTIDDPVMAEYITIMLINSKTPDQITNELQDLIGDEYDPEFTNWLFTAKANPNPSPPASTTHNAPPEPQTDAPDLPSTSSKDTPLAKQSVGGPGRANRSSVPRPLINQALSGMSNTPSTAPSAQKRTSSARSPSPHSGPAAKRRHADLPDRPRAMRDEIATNNNPSTSRPNRPSLIDRVGPMSNSRNPPPNATHPIDRVQAQIDAVTQASLPPHQHHQASIVHPQPPFNGFPPQMMMSGMMPAMMNPHDLMQGMMEAQMAMAQFGQMAVQMGLIPGVNLDNFQSGSMAPPQNEPAGAFKGHVGDRDRRGRGTAGGFTGRPKSGPTGRQQEPIDGRPIPPPQPAQESNPENLISQPAPQPSSSNSIVQPTPLPLSAPATFNVPARPLSPTLCKFSTACTNPHCRYSHPSPAATPESGIVLSMDPCPAGLSCGDKDCKFAHVSKAAAGATVSAPSSANPSNPSKIPCKYNPHCTRPGCAFLHFSPGSKNHSTIPCRFGAACTRADCPYGHPAGRVLPSSFSQGLGAAAPTQFKSTDHSPHRSVDFRARAKATEKEPSTSTPLSKDAPPFVPKAGVPPPKSDSGETKAPEVHNEAVSVA